MLTAFRYVPLIPQSSVPAERPQGARGGSAARVAAAAACLILGMAAAIAVSLLRDSSPSASLPRTPAEVASMRGRLRALVWPSSSLPVARPRTIGRRLRVDLPDG